MRNYRPSKLLIVVFWSYMFCTSVFGQRDTLWIEWGGQDELFISHIVKPGETLYALSRFYGASVDQLQSHNLIKPQDLKVGDSIRVNINNEAILPVCQLEGMRPKSLQAVVAYRVRPGDNAFHISKRIFKQDEACLFPNNKNRNLQVDSIVVAGYFHSHNSWQNYTSRKDSYTPMDKDQKVLEENFWSQKKNRKAFHRNGAAIAMEGQPTEGYLVLMDDLPINTTVHLMNPMNNEECYAKVVGKIPVKMKKENIIVVSELVMRKLNVRDNRFRIFVEYFK